MVLRIKAYLSSSETPELGEKKFTHIQCIVGGVDRSSPYKDLPVLLVGGVVCWSLLIIIEKTKT